MAKKKQKQKILKRKKVFDHTNATALVGVGPAAVSTVFGLCYRLGIVVGGLVGAAINYNSVIRT